MRLLTVPLAFEESYYWLRPNARCAQSVETNASRVKYVYLTIYIYFNIYIYLSQCTSSMRACVCVCVRYSDGDNVIENKQHGFLMRTKRVGVNEGGLMSGSAFLDSPHLVD
jgi:hypothetical protein